ncbi:DUF362 domain-containing protein [Leadbettera azotonutricia]|uniref:DUF362 domain-containing protein n=1 Tax=Leadbettera azotonutricia (strain ATCC BAA-888 / DSM 13862 / ZAS-9) TaxID=545695 RepID=F5Y6X6_LEAAZ|nr:DUF362 domain-containing protein [Leadbettera azotonutricia]AEF81410.1 conserved hypothetical protein [Leadbettera azotonutricia ZAS-9]
MEKNEILVIYGSDPSDMAEKLAEAANLAALVGDKNKRIGLKPNLVVSRPANEGATTHPEIAAGLIAYLKKNGFNNLVILEGSWVGDSTSDAFSVCGYRKLAKDAGVELIDTQTDKARVYDCKGMKIEICDSARAVDFMINLPVMKGHCQTLLTCALKNNKGIMPDREKRRFHSEGLHKPIAHLNTVARNDFIVVDGICGDLDFEEGGNPVFAGRMFAALDPVLCDAWAANLMGLDTRDIPYIGLVEKLGVGTADITKAAIRELTPPSEHSSSAGSSTAGTSRPGGKVKQLASYIHEDSACSACYAALVFALSRLNRSELSSFKEPIAIGQGFQNKQGKIGVGRCTKSFTASCPGCPPSGADILKFLRLSD